MSDSIKKYYEQYPDIYGEGGYKMERSKDTSRVRLIKEWLEQWVPSGGRVLDVGCGDFYLSRLMPQYDWHGIDIHNKYNNKVTLHDIQVKPYPYEDLSFDGIVCSETLEHLFFPLTVHEEAHRLLKPKGTYVISTPNFDNADHFYSQFRELEYDPRESHRVEHIRWYSKSKHEELLSMCNFRTAEYCGADAHFMRCMVSARESLVKQGLAADVFEADYILGKCFPLTSHTILLRARKL